MGSSNEPFRSEGEWLDWVTGFVGAGGNRVEIGPGDDAAVLALGADAGSAVVTVDTLVEGLHFESEVDPGALGRKSLAVNLSDIAAMAALPVAAVVSICAPARWESPRLRGLMNGIREMAREFDVDVVGGDFSSTRGPLVVTVALLGETRGVKPVRSSGARPGDRLLVTGSLGGAGLGRHLAFRPRVEEGRRLAAHGVHAMTDLSDGLSRDLRKMARASGVGARVDAHRLPVSRDAERRARTSGRAPIWHALHDGEDFELLVALPSDRAARTLADGALGVPLTEIGEVTQEGLVLRDAEGRTEPLPMEGYEHVLGDPDP